MANTGFFSSLSDPFSSRDYECANYDNAFIRFINWCPDVQISPIVVTPAAPRSRAEMTSGLWTPDEAVRLTWEKIANEKKQQQAIAAAGDWRMPMGDGTPKDVQNMAVSDWILVGGLVIAGLVVVKSVLR
jgi:tetrahydromethanopterin S-methyltransferase subunit H